MKKSQELLSALLAALPETREFHARDGATYKLLNNVASECVAKLFGKNGPHRAFMESAGEVVFPYVSMGTINSTHLFGLDELIIFSFYARNRRNYSRVADIGGNIGLHSIVLAKLGYEVSCFEPDPMHLELLARNLAVNNVTHCVEVHSKAVSTQKGSLEFIRLLGNTTGSHLAGAKNAPYGELEKFSVLTVPVVDVMHDVDLVKIDVEGHELELVKVTTAEDWKSTDAMIEVGSPENAEGVFRHLDQIGVNMFSQKTGWRHVTNLEQVPTSHREGSLFITGRSEMNWS